MRCEKCHSKLKVTNTYTVPEGHVQRRECPKCDTVLVTETKVVSINPKWGQGATALASQRNKK